VLLLLLLLPPPLLPVLPCVLPLQLQQVSHLQLPPQAAAAAA
jgi:hypothetical protein